LIDTWRWSADEDNVSLNNGKKISTFGLNFELSLDYKSPTGTAGGTEEQNRAWSWLFV
jgi:hypothetical protein